MATNDNSLRLSGWLRKTDHGAGHRPYRGKLKRAGAEQPAGTKEGVHHQWKLLTAPWHHHHHVLVLSWTTSCGCGVNWTVSGSAQHLLFWTEGEEWRERGGKKIHFTLKIITGLESCSREWTKSWTTPPLSNLFLILKKKRKMHHNATGATITTSPADKQWSGLSAVYKNLVKSFRCR